MLLLHASIVDGWPLLLSVPLGCLQSTRVELAKLPKLLILHLKASFGLTTRVTIGCKPNACKTLVVAVCHSICPMSCLAALSQLSENCTALQGDWFCLQPSYLSAMQQALSLLQHYWPQQGMAHAPSPCRQPYN
jgi:hypothetical protein